MKVYAPNKAFSGNIGDATFRDGVAEVDDKSNALNYFRRHGFGIGKRLTADENVNDELPVDFDHRARQGTALRDAAVDPQPEDFLAPVNAGEAHPHSRQVVSPEIHHGGPKGIKPGDVHVDDTAAQERDEKKLAASVLIKGEEHPAQPVDGDVDRGPLGMSDPGSVQKGQETGAPARSASQKAWATWAVSQGADPAEAESATRKELIERYGGEG